MLILLLLYLPQLIHALQISYCSKTNTGSSLVISSIFQSNGLCHDKCLEEDYGLAILSGKDCYCSNEIPSEVVDTNDCYISCPGYLSDYCGGNDYFAYIVLNQNIISSSGEDESTSETMSTIESSNIESTRTATTTTATPSSSSQTIKTFITPVSSSTTDVLSTTNTLSTRGTLNTEGTSNDTDPQSITEISGLTETSSTTEPKSETEIPSETSSTGKTLKASTASTEIPNSLYISTYSTLPSAFTTEGTSSHITESFSTSSSSKSLHLSSIIPNVISKSSVPASTSVISDANSLSTVTTHGTIVSTPTLISIIYSVITANGSHVTLVTEVKTTFTSISTDFYGVTEGTTIKTTTPSSTPSSSISNNTSGRLLNDSKSQSASKGSFWGNKARVAGVFVTVGVIFLLLMIFASFLIIRFCSRRSHSPQRRQSTINLDDDGDNSAVISETLQDSASDRSQVSYDEKSGILATTKHKRNVSIISSNDYGTPYINKEGESTYIDQRLNFYKFNASESREELDEVLSLEDDQDYSRMVYRVVNP
ncbi:hypothetical protein WICMUC_003686 [Wickerhamomyces mucosus]|uniref:WSC domain-containing protein n=1 Tax=Wickerhamomyces mucosus TaxID=1378264 RepID=A0A9P8PJR9_9ASCO|nr:hypothetical protein WICMUC_003686 [Wickerhamomyces mucosus]